MNRHQHRQMSKHTNKAERCSSVEGWRWYLVEYEYNDSKWTLDLLAENDEDASMRVDSLFHPKLLGERKMTIKLLMDRE